ncbi:PD-(D/E)XK nuclease family protein [Methylobacterium sp. WL19]|uniref:PD-(D/E)XK nuclease family protein n=1 Tax=Methylobacterium sp. WL19 TaxID=2603896 RepID=UPI0011C8E95D|nr:PD-(D/E)XK nuclease family protein [Methylobacterium sp. WL19]TXN27670.1 PD-(D/E)XK nuclease family protein [Methylobacterium sp. WL19]
MKRRTYIAHGRLASREIRLDAARGQRHGVQVMSFEQMAARLAGGFMQPIDAEALRDAIQQALPDTMLGELDAIKLLPGMVGAAADTLQKVWRTGLDLSGRSAVHPRLAAMATLEKAVLAGLPASMLRPADLACKALARISHAPVLFGEIEILGISELAPCWRDLLLSLAETLPVRWNAGPRSLPEWIEGSAVKIIRSAPATPQVEAISAASGYHEAIEALRWARELIASGTAKPAEIAIAAAAPAAYDDEFMALRADANLDLHFVHSIRVVTTRDGQAAAALADILVRGISQTRLRRLATLLSGLGPFKELPDAWQRVLPSGAPLSSANAWAQFLNGLTAEHWPDGIDHTPKLRAIIERLAGGSALAEETGPVFLSGAALRIWRKALLAGSGAAIDVTIDGLRQEDPSEACVSVAWLPASALAASPRKFVRLLGLTSTGWPRRISEDRLLSDHIVPTGEIDPWPVTAADRRDFETILRTTTTQVVLSRARRDKEGRLLGKSPLLRGQPDFRYIRRNRRPDHAMSETDRLLARPADFVDGAQGRAVAECWRHWQQPAVTPHDGIVPPDHPALLAALDRVQSASSLTKLLRNPLGFTWSYALGVRAPESAEEALVLDARQSGILLHETLDHAVRMLERQGSLAAAGPDQIESAIEQAAAAVAEQWQGQQAVPPLVVWRRTVEDTRDTARNALQHPGAALDGQKSYTEVPFGGQSAKSGGGLPWNPAGPVAIADTGFRISGYIDRLDLSGDGRQARVLDYKSGRLPAKPVTLQGGKELQRCLYAYAVKALLGDEIEIYAALLYPRDTETRQLEEPAVVLEALATHLRAARQNLLAGRALIGPDNGGEYDDLSFALPANATNGYCPRKLDPVREALGDAALVWEAI